MVVRVLLAVGLGLAVGVGALWRRRQAGSGRFVPGSDRVAPEQIPDRARGQWAVLGFTSPLCQPCRETPQIAERAIAAADVDAVFAALDIREHPGLVDAVDVRETPTVLVLDPQGRIRFGQTGNPDPEALAAVLAREVGA